MHRRSGKTKTILNKQIRRTHKRKGLYLYLLPTYTQAKKVIWQDPEMMKHFPDALIEKKNDSELLIKFKNGSMWLLGGADNPNSWRGTNPIDVVFDEYPEHKRETWTQIIRPILTENKGTATFIFTPKGRDHAWELFQYAKQNRGKIWDWSFQTVEDTKSISLEELEEAKREMTEAFYNQEFMCEFAEGAGQVFKRIDNNIWPGNLQPMEGKMYQLGVDLAKYQDWTVLTPFDMHTFQAGIPERFNQIDWPLQESKIEAMARRFNRAAIKIDSTGIGDPVSDQLEAKGLNIDPINFGSGQKDNLMRKQLLENLMILLANDKIKIPDYQILIDELKSFQFSLAINELTGRRKIIMKVPSGLHDDCVMSLALAVWGISTPIPHRTVRKPSSEFSQSPEFAPEFQKSRFHYDT